MNKTRYYINGNETDYEIYDDGRIYSIKYKKFLKPYKTKSGYLNVDIYCGGSRYKKGVHQLVAEAFIPNPENKHTVNHKNFDKTDNRVTNLEWATQSEQNIHSYKMNSDRKKYQGSKVHFANNNEEIIDTVCQYLSKGYSPLEVSGFTGVPVKDIYEVRNRKTWKHVSVNNTFPSSRPIRNTLVSLKDRDEAEKLLISGHTVKEVCEILNLPNDKKIPKIIHDLKYNLKKAQRLTEDDGYYHIHINLLCRFISL